MQDPLVDWWGGTGEAYRATDSTLKRDVALKVLPAYISNDPERRARLQRKAERGSLDHSNIGHIYAWSNPKAPACWCWL